MFKRLSLVTYPISVCTLTKHLSKVKTANVLRSVGNVMEPELLAVFTSVLDQFRRSADKLSQYIEFFEVSGNGCKEENEAVYLRFQIM